MLNVSTHRKERDWSLAELSERSGVSVPTIERIERDERRPICEYDPRISRVVKLADAFGLPVDALIHERAHEPNLPDAHGRAPHGTSEKTTDRDALPGTPAPRSE